MKLSEDIRNIKEWSLIMAITGVFNAINRNLLTDYDQVIIHVSGIYTSEDYTKMDENDYTVVTNSKDIYMQL